MAENDPNTPTDPYPGIPLRHPQSGRYFAPGERKILFEAQQKRLAQGGGRHRDPLAAPTPEPESEPVEDWQPTTGRGRQDDTVTFAPLDDDDEEDEKWDRERERRRSGAHAATVHRADARPGNWAGMSARLTDRSRARKAMGSTRWRPPLWLAILMLVVGFALGALVATTGIMADPTILPDTALPTVTLAPAVPVPAQ